MDRLNSSSLRPSWLRTGRALAIRAIIIVACACGTAPSCPAEEPYRQFLEKLRNEQLFDLALGYLDDLEKNQAADAAFATEIPLERAQSRVDQAPAIEVTLLHQRDESGRPGVIALRILVVRSLGACLAGTRRPQSVDSANSRIRRVRRPGHADRDVVTAGATAQARRLVR